MPELSDLRTAQADRDQTVRAVAQLATRQRGVIGTRQLRALGVSANSISVWARAGRLIPIHPRVYAVGHRHLDDRARCIAGLLYAGPGAALSHTTAAWHWEIIDSRPARVHVSAPGFVQSLEGVAVHHPRSLYTVVLGGLRVTAVGRTLVDTAGMLSESMTAKAVANASYRGLLDPAEAVSALKRGRRGSAALRRALSHLLPELARTASPLEDLFVLACDAAGLPPPQMNRNVAGFRVDAVWPDHRLIVELDGTWAHGHATAVHVDRSRDMALRRAGWTILRYSRRQIEHEWHLVLRELRAHLSPPELTDLHTASA